MTILQQPDVLSLSGNIAPFRINSASPVLFTLRQGSEEILSHRYAPGPDGYITIDIRDIVHARLSFLLQESSTVYVQPSLAATFTAVIDGTEVNFRVVRAGVDRLTDTTSNFLTQNFLSWQPSVKPVTYYSPEFLTYYAILPCKAKLRAYFTDSSGNMISQQDLELYTFASGNAYTIPLQYAIVAGQLGHKLPAYYDVWIENNSSERLTYIQRYYASDMRSEQEQWILFENSLGGIDTFRAYGTTDFTGEHTHNIAEVEDIAFEYRVDTERKFQKNTGHLNRKERQWLLDFFPSEVKYIYSGSALRRIVVVESNVTYTDRELPSHYTFTYRYADARPLLNLPRTDIPTEVLNITVPEVGSFTVPPRLVEFSRLSLTEGALFPVQQPYSEEWNTTTAGALEEYISNRIYAKYNAAWSKQIYLIRRNDKTPPTEENAYSALEADNKFLTKEEVPDSYFTKKRSPDGQEYLHTNYPLVLERYAVFGYGDTPYLPSMFEEIPLDQQTLGWKDGVITVLGGGGSDFDELAMWGVLGKEGVQQIDKSHLSGALAGYATEKFVTDKGYITSSALTGYATETFVRENFVTLTGAQEITGEKDFTGGLKVNGGLLDYDPTHKVWKLDGNLLITGSTTWNAVGDYTAPTLLDLLPYDPATLSKEGGKLSVIGGGGSGGGGNIMLNGTLYEAANGVITLPDLYQKTPNGTASQFLKADGSLDSNLYALAYGGDQNSIQYSSKSNYLRVIDRRNDTILPTSYDNYNISGLFHMSGMPSSNWWSGIHVKGWGEGYATWELVGPSSTDNTNNRLYYRDGKGSSWATDWKGIAFLEDCNKVATPYFEGQNIYSDYGWWVVALCKLSPADSEYNYASGTMFYRRGNGIYPNGSVQFNVIKRYNQTNVNFGVLYNGYGINEGEDAPKPCTFTYNGVKYAGLKWASAASLDSIKTLIYDISTTGLPFYVKYFNSQSGEVFNTEIKNSIVELGSDISGTGLGTIGTIRILNRKAIDIKGEDWGYIQQASADRMFHVAVAKSTQSGLGGGLGNYEIRCNGTSEEGIFVRYSGSSYGKLGVVNRNGQESSISYYNNNIAVGADKPLWTVGAGIRNAYSFDWWFGTNGYRMTLDSDGKLFINRTNNNEGGPSVSLAIGDSDTGLHWQADGIIEFRSNAKQVGYWGYTNGRLFNCYFREPSGVTYEKASLMINGNGSTISPSIGFHQPGVVGCHLELDNGGNFRFKDSSGYRNVYAGNLIADAGFLYSRYNGIEIKIGSENDSYVHFITKPARSLYFANSLFVNGSVLPYSSSTYSLGDAGHLWNYVYGNHFMGNSASATFILPNYVGGQQANPQTYFNNSMGVKVAMTGVNPDSYWGDTLWINGYGGTDVPDMCALHFSRGGAPLIYISSQKYHATSYGTMYHIWTGYNSNHSSAAWTCSTLNANGRISTTSDIYSAGWVRAGGSNGFYCESYGGGIHMTDSTWVRVYNGKQFYVSSTSSDAIHTAGGINASGRIYAGGHLSTNGGLAVSGIYGDSGASGFNVYAVFQGRSDHGGIEVRASDNTFGIGVHSNDHMYWWWGTSTSTNSSSGKSYIMDYGGGNWSFTGNHYVSGYSTWGSDSRYKTYLGEVTLQLDQIADSPTIYYRWNSKKRDRDGLLHVGGYAQYTEQILPELTHDTSNFKTMDYAVCAYVYAVHAARFLRDHLLSDYKWKSDTELRMYALEKENIKLRNRIEQLERRAA